MKNPLKLKPLIRRLNEGTFFHNYFAFILVLFSICLLVFSVFLSISLWKEYYKIIDKLASGVDYTDILIFCLVVQIFGVILLSLIINLIFIRANQIRKLSKNSSYIIAPAFVVIIKLSGEILFLKYLFFGLLNSISIWMNFNFNIFSNIFSNLPMQYLFRFGYGLFGFASIAIGFSLGCSFLIVSYFSAELLNLLLDFSNRNKKNNLD